jgi:alkylhydroperoxidase/carboxymuconolactone decarboxylase family protein YurZ
MSEKEKKEKDLSMTDEAWNKRTGRILGFLEHKDNKKFLASTPDIIDAVELINMNIKRGNRTADKRKNLWNQILIEGRDWTMEKQELLTMDWPVSIGKESNLPAHVQASLKQIAQATEDAYVEFWNANPIIQQTAIISDRNKELGGSPYENGLEMAKARGFANKQRFTKFFNDGRWDGNFDLDVGFGITPPPAEEEAQVSEGESDEDSA